MTAAEELAAWAADRGRWTERAAGDWHSLIDDAVASFEQLGPNLSATVDVKSALVALRAVSRSRKLRPADHEQAILAASSALRQCFQQQGALEAAASDLLLAARECRNPQSLDPSTRWRLAVLASVGEQLGYDWAVIAGRIDRALSMYGNRDHTGVTEAVLSALPTTVSSGHSVVWLGIDHASASGPSPNPAVQLFDGDWLMAVLQNWDGPRDGLPTEVVAHAERLATIWRRLQNEPAGDKLPVVLARVDLGRGPTAQARERATDTLRLLISRASVIQGGTNWRLSRSCLHFVDGELISEWHSPLGDPDVYDRLSHIDILNDPTADTIWKESERLRAHLPVAPGPMHTALELAAWLQDARRTPPAARLVLASRIIETAATWADIRKADLVPEYLVAPRSVELLSQDLASAGRYGVLRLEGADGTSATPQARDEFLSAAEEILIERGRGFTEARPFATFRRLEWLAERHPGDTEIGDFLAELLDRLASGPVLANWLNSQRKNLLVLNARVVRSRNAIVHGGPLVSDVARNVVGEADRFAQRALEWVTDALATGQPVSELFNQRKQRFDGALERLASGTTGPETELPGLME